MKRLEMAGGTKKGEAMAGAAQVSSDMPLNTLSHWYAIHTRPKHERKVVEELGTRGIPAYLPMISQVHRWSDRRKIIHCPLFPRYAFIRAALDSVVRASLLRIWGVLGLVGANKQGVHIPESQIDHIRTLLESKVPFTQCPFVKVGQRVRIRGGALDGLEGILVTNGDRHLVISVEGIERSLSISLQGYDIEAA